MGTFAHLYAEEGGRIPDNQKAEFSKRIEKIYQSGGMMNVESYHYSEMQYDESMEFGSKRYGYIGGCEIWAVLYGTDEAIEEFSSKESGELENFALKYMKSVKKTIKEYMQNSGEEYDEQLKVLMDSIRKYYKADSVEDWNKEIDKIMDRLSLSDAPAFVVKAIAEIYNKEFWDLWEQIRDIVKRKNSKLYGSDGYYVIPITTVDFLRQAPDDMIPYWSEESDFEFSKELWEWFEVIKNKFDTLVNSVFVIEHPLEYVLGLMEDADNNYYQIYTFSEFFEETLENLKDKRYQALWKLYDEMLNEPEFIEAGDVIFKPKESEREDVAGFGKVGTRSLRTVWDMISIDERNNKARVTFRRYMALVANRELRKKVFGF